MPRKPVAQLRDFTRDALPLLFVVLALVSLAAVPYLGWMERQRMRMEIEEAESARHLGAEHGIALAHQGSSIQMYLLSGEERFLRAYVESRAHRHAVLRDLRPLVREVDPELETELLRLAESVEVWEAPSDALVRGDIAPEPLRARLAEQQLLYEELIRAEGALDSALAGVVTEQRRAIRRAERRTLIWTSLLAAIALAGVLVMASIGLRMYRLRREMQAHAARTDSLNRSLAAQVDEVQRLNGELQALNEELVSLTVAADVAREAAEHANRAKSGFLAVMSHELRTPLNAIAGYVDLLQMGIHGAVTEAQTGALKRIKHNQEHLLRLINDVLQFASLQVGKIEVRTADVSVSEILTAVEAMILPQIEAKGVRYTSPAPETEARVRGDPERISQILLNLVGNALKFTPPQGNIGVRSEVNEDTVALHVSDTGRGIPAQRLRSVFEPFVQVRSGAADDVGRDGVGLGLAISRDLARAMGGDLGAESLEGEGSTFTLTLLRGRREATSILLHPEEAGEDSGA